MSRIDVVLPPEVVEMARGQAREAGMALEEYLAELLTRRVRVDTLLAAARDVRLDDATRQRHRRRLRELLAKVPDVPRMPGDEVPPDLRQRIESLRKDPK